MDGGCTCPWMDCGWANVHGGWAHPWMLGHIHGWMVSGHIHGRMEIFVGGCTNPWMDGRNGGWMVNGHIHEWVDGRWRYIWRNEGRAYPWMGGGWSYIH